jgi:ABC-type lipoprotein release transport system permease subunit
MIFRMALKNLFLHKSKTVIIGILLVVAMVVMVFGNSLMDNAKAASEQAWIKSYAADLMIRPRYQQSELTILGFLFGSDTEKLVRVAPYSAIRDLLAANPAVIGFSPTVQTFTKLSFGDDKYSGGSLMGVDPLAYQRTFPDSMRLVEGRFLVPGEEGIVVTQNIIDQVRNVLKIPVKIGDLINVTGFQSDLAVKELKLVGVFHYNTDNRMCQMSAFTDLKSARHLAAFGEDDDAPAKISATASQVSDKLSADGNMDDLFTDNNLVTQSAGNDVAALSTPLAASHLVDQPVPDYKDGAFHFILVRLAPGADRAAVRAQLQDQISRLNPRMEVTTWYGASGGFVYMTEIVRLLFLILVIILCFVTAFVIMNALLISIAERTVEIGTMRALGGQKSFVLRVFVTESMVLTFGFGLIGILAAVLVVWGFNLSPIAINDGFTAAMFGSARLQPTISLSSIVWSLLILTVVGLLSSVYPTYKALKLTPVEALSR